MKRLRSAYAVILSLLVTAPKYSHRGCSFGGWLYGDWFADSLVMTKYERSKTPQPQLLMDVTNSAALAYPG